MKTRTIHTACCIKSGIYLPDYQYMIEEHFRRLLPECLTSMISQHIHILFLDSCCSCARLGAVAYRCSQVYDTTRMPAADGIFSRSFWLSATLTVFTPAARPVSRTFTMGPMILTSSSSPPPVPARYGLISASTWNVVFNGDTNTFSYPSLTFFVSV